MKMILPQHEFARWILDNKRGLLAVFGGFLIQLCAGDRYITLASSQIFFGSKMLLKSQFMVGLNVK